MTRQLNKVKSMETTIAYQKVIGWFFAYPLKEMSLNDLSAALNMPKTTAKKVVEQLIKEGFLNRELFGKMWKISCNQNHIYNHTRKISQNLNMIFESQILDILHDKIRNPKSVILFGSYRKGDDNEKRDIDFTLSLNITDESGPTIVRNIYECFRMLGDALLVAKGIESEDHIAPIKELNLIKVETIRPINLVDNLRRLRHNVNYYGYKPSLHEVQDVISIARSIFQPLLHVVRSKL